jgi:D-lactate dehydrogenase (cytochrome)
MQEANLAGHSGSEWSSYTTTETEKPHIVLYPSSTLEVSSIMKVCHRRSLPVTAFSGGTSLEGHFAPTRGGVCIDFERMDQLLSLHNHDLDVVVQPSLGWEDLNELLAEHGLFFPPDPGPGAKIGGMVGTGCSGTNTYRYGTMREWVLSLTVVLADGTIIKTRQRAKKSSAGYDLTKVFIGSEGTLGLVTEAVLKVIPLPQYQRVAVATFPTIEAAAELVSRVVEAGLPLSGIEILDDVQMRCINQSKVTSRTWREATTLFFKFSGTPLGVMEQIGIVKEMAKGSKSFEFASSDDEAKELWSARKEALWSVLAMKRNPMDHIWTTDVCVPISKLSEIIVSTKEDIERSGLLGTIVGHLGDGNFHAFLLFNEAEREVAEGLVHRMAERAMVLEGTVTGEHGVGLIKRDYLPRELGQTTVDAMRRIKAAFDPKCLLNCDKVVRMEESLSE